MYGTDVFERNSPKSTVKRVKLGNISPFAARMIPEIENGTFGQAESIQVADIFSVGKKSQHVDKVISDLYAIKCNI